MANMVTRQDRQVHEKLRKKAGAGHDDRWKAAVTAYDDARVDGLCHEGAWECALAALGVTQSEQPGAITNSR